MQLQEAGKHSTDVYLPNSHMSLKFLDHKHAIANTKTFLFRRLQVCQKYMPANSTIIGVDLLPIRAIPNVITLMEDITTEKCRVAIKSKLKDGMVDAVLNDGAPNVGGGASWSKDAYMQIELVIHSLKLATHFLRAGGTFCTKVFRSQDYNALLWVLRQFFKQITISKPASSRASSAEIFVVCEGYLAPKKIDPKLLNPAHIFAAPADSQEKKQPDVFHQKANARNREGYADDVGQLLYTKTSVANFIEGQNAVEMLGQYNLFEFDEDSQIYLNHAATTDEIKELCKDLKVLGKGDFSALLKWRKKLLAWKAELMKEEEPEVEAEPEPELTPGIQVSLYLGIIYPTFDTNFIYPPFILSLIASYPT